MANGFSLRRNLTLRAKAGNSSVRVDDDDLGDLRSRWCLVWHDWPFNA